MNAQHAPLSCSGIEQIVHCAGAMQMRRQFPENEEGEAAKEGTAAHWVCNEMFYGRSVARGQFAPNGVAVTQEMLEGAEILCDTLDDLEGWHAEETLPAGRFHPDNWGTPDYWRWNPETGLLRLVEYKFGHIRHDAFEHWQSVNYVGLILDKLGINGLQDAHVTVLIEIVQPRGFFKDGPVRSWPVKASSLRPYFNKIEGACYAAVAPEAPCVSGAHCRHCSARHACETFQRSAYNAIDVSSEQTPNLLNAEAVGKELDVIDRALETLKARRTGLEEQAVDMERKGCRVPGWRLETTLGREVWTVPPEQVVILGQTFGVDLSKPGVLTPNQAAKKGAGAGLAKEDLAVFTTRENKGFTLVRDDGSDTRRAFGS